MNKKDSQVSDYKHILLDDGTIVLTNPEDKIPIINNIRIKPTALFEILRNKSSSSPHPKGILFGYVHFKHDEKISSELTDFKGLKDTDENEDYIEIVSYCPEYNEKKTDEERKKNIMEIRKTYGEQLDSLKAPSSPIGLYTSDNIGGRPINDTFDINNLISMQKEDPNLFLLVVSANPASFSIRAFRLSNSAIICLKKTNDLTNSYYFEKDFFHDDIFDELNVSFHISKKEKILLSNMLGGFNLVSNILTLSEISNVYNQVKLLTEDLNDCIKFSDEFKKHITGVKTKYEEKNKKKDEYDEKTRKREYMESFRNQNSELRTFPGSFQFKIYGAFSRSKSAEKDIESELNKLDLALAFSKALQENK